MNRLPGLLICLLTFNGCSDILEEDISNDMVILTAPANGAAVQQNTVTFWWEELEGSTSYRLQIVSPSFDSVVTLVANETIEEATSFEMTLATGSYQWKVVGVNFGYETESNDVFDLTIESDTTLSLSDEVLILTNPSLDAAVNTGIIQFSWQALIGVGSYNLQIASPDFSNSSFMISNELLINTTIAKTLAEGDYKWRVRGQNDTSVSPFTERSLTIDLTAPNQPVLTAPANGAMVNAPILLDWTADLASERDTLYIYGDSLMVVTVLKLPLTDTEYSFDNSADNYFWRVRTVDLADNKSPFSELRKFIVE